MTTFSNSSRFLAVGGLNFVIGNGIFLVLWNILSEQTSYIVIAFLSLVIASLISYTTHFRITLKNSSNLLSSKTRFLTYVVFQIVAVSLGGVLVPTFAALTTFSLIFFQFTWSAITSITGFFLIPSQDTKVLKQGCQ